MFGSPRQQQAPARTQRRRGTVSGGKPKALAYAEEMISRGQAEEKKQDLDGALNFYLLAHRHQVAWLESLCSGNARTDDATARELARTVEDLVSVRERLEQERGAVRQQQEEEEPWREVDESRFLDEYSYYYAKGAEKQQRRLRPEIPSEDHSSLEQRARIQTVLQHRLGNNKGDVQRAMAARKVKSVKQPWRPTSRKPTQQPPKPMTTSAAQHRKVRAYTEQPDGYIDPTDAHIGMLESIASPNKSLRSMTASTEPASSATELRGILEQKETQILMLTRQLEAAGCSAITEVVPLDEAKSRLQFAIASMMGDGAARQADSRRKLSDAEAEAEFEKWDKFINHHPEHIENLRNEAAEWEEANRPQAEEALKKMLTYVPVTVLSEGTSKDEMVEQGLTPKLALRVYRTPALWLLRADTAEFIAKIHDADLVAKYSFSQLDLVELRALWCRVKSVVWENDALKRKEGWRCSLMDRLKEATQREETLDPSRRRFAAYLELETGPFDPEAPIAPVRTASAHAIIEIIDCSSSEKEERELMMLEDERELPFSPQSPVTPRLSVVSLAKESLLRSVSFKADTPPYLPSARLSSSSIARPPRRNSLTTPPGDLISELKLSLKRRGSISEIIPILDDDDINEEEGAADDAKRPPRSPRRNSFPATKYSPKEGSGRPPPPPPRTTQPADVSSTSRPKPPPPPPRRKSSLETQPAPKLDLMAAIALKAQERALKVAANDADSAAAPSF